MPCYEFRCTECNNEFEVILPISQYEKPTLEPCSKCGEKTIEQIIGASAIIDSVRLGIRQPDRRFTREILGRMAKNIPHNKIGQGRFHIPGRV
jgi:putative FmdB family regulatory protein